MKNDNSVIPKVEPRLQGFKLKEIFFKNINQWSQNENQAGMSPKLQENHKIIQEIGWYVIRAIRKS